VGRRPVEAGRGASGPGSDPHEGQSPKRPDTALKGLRYEKEPERAWEELLDLSNAVEQRVSELERAIAAAGSSAGIAITEGHLSLSPHNTNPILYEWLSAVTMPGH